MTDLNGLIDRAAARLTHAEPRPDVRARVLASIAHAPRTTLASTRWRFALRAAGIVVLLGAAVAVARWRGRDVSHDVRTTLAASVTAIGAPAASAVHEHGVSATVTTKSATSKKRAARPPVPDYVTPTPLPVVSVDAIDAPVEIQPTPLSIPQLSRTPIAPGPVSTTGLGESGSSRER